MKKVYLSVIGFSFLCHLNARAQMRQDTSANRPKNELPVAPAKPDSNKYNPRKLRLDEIDLVSSYYNQTGDHAAVEGGIGSEAVTDFANSLTLNLVWNGRTGNKNTLVAGMGFDYHTAASQAYVSPTGASKASGTRVYPSLDWTSESAKTGNTFGFGAYYSGEVNYRSLGLDAHFSIKTDNKMGEFSTKLQAYLDKVTLIFPDEFEPQTTPVITGTGDFHHRRNYGSSSRNTYSASFEYSQQINSRLQVALLGDLVTQSGYIGLPFHRVYFSNAKDTIEKLPSSRFKLPVGLRANYFMGDNIILRAYYRYYADSWGIRSNTINFEVPYKITPFFSISPFYRYYSQSASFYFAPYEMHNLTDAYYTSNYEYSKFNSQFFGAGFRIAPPKGVFGVQGFHELELRYGHYSQTTDLVSDVISLQLGFK